jgi:type IV pilus assembly protein PilM
VSEGLPADRAWEDDMSQFLAVVNVEAVYTRYTDDVKGFLERSASFVDTKYGNQIAKDWDAADQEKDETTGKIKPKLTLEGATNAGWIVELRGYTYHKDAVTGFLDRCLLDNFKKFNAYAESSEKDKTSGKLKVELVIPGLTDPIKGNVKYPFLMLKQKSRSSLPNQFDHINASLIDGFIGGSSAAGPGADGEAPAGRGPAGRSGGIPGGGMEMGANNALGGGGDGSAGPGAAASTPTGFSQWSPVFGSGGVAAGGMGPMGSSMGGGMSGSTMPRGGRGMAGGLSMGGASMGGSSSDAGGTPGGMTSDAGSPGTTMPGSAATSPKAASKVRTEFVLVFIWREPTPSDPTPGSDGTAIATTPAPTTPTP